MVNVQSLIGHGFFLIKIAAKSDIIESLCLIKGCIVRDGEG